MGWLANLFTRRRYDVEQTFTPTPPTYGEEFIPHAVWRKYEQIRRAMRASDLLEVYRLQKALKRSGLEMPTKLSEIDEIIGRLKDRQKHFQKGLRCNSEH